MPEQQRIFLQAACKAPFEAYRLRLKGLPGGTRSRLHFAEMWRGIAPSHSYPPDPPSRRPFHALTAALPGLLPAPQELREFCLQHGVTYQTFWTLTANPHLLGSAVVERTAARLAEATDQATARPPFPPSLLRAASATVRPRLSPARALLYIYRNSASGFAAKNSLT